MKTLLKILSLSTLLISFSCTKVIEIDLNDAAPQIAIEAQLLEGTNNFTTIVTKTGNYFGGSPTNVTGAVVTLNDGTTSTTLTDNNDGTYSIAGYTAVENATYTLTVVSEGETYEAISTMPTITNLDTIGFDFQEASAFSDSGYFTFFVFQDDPAADNFYRGTLIVNDTLTKELDDLYIFDDQFTDGNLVVIPVFGEIYDVNDSITANLYSLNKEGYDYYTTIDQIIGNSGGGNVAPANPTTNWSNGALGCFITTGVRSNSAVVKQSL